MRSSQALPLLFSVSVLAAARPQYDDPIVDPPADYSTASSSMMATASMTTSMLAEETEYEDDGMNALSYFTTTWTTTEANGMVMTYVSSCTGEEETPTPTPTPEPAPAPEPTPAPPPPMRPPMPAPAPSAPPAAPTYPSSPSIVPATGSAAEWKVEMGVAVVAIFGSLGMAMLL